jgi:hypothetical protein
MYRRRQFPAMPIETIARRSNILHLASNFTEKIGILPQLFIYTRCYRLAIAEGGMGLVDSGPVGNIK